MKDPILDEIQCPSCYGTGEWEAECCNGAGSCSCRGERVPMGRCNVCQGTGRVPANITEEQQMANCRAIQGLHFIGSGPRGMYSIWPNRGNFIPATSRRNQFGETVNPNAEPALAPVIITPSDAYDQGRGARLCGMAPAVAWVIARAMKLAAVRRDKHVRLEDLQQAMIDHDGNAMNTEQRQNSVSTENIEQSASIADTEAKPGSMHPACSAFERVRLTDVTVHQMLKHGRSLEETIVALVQEKNRFTQRIIELESIAPRKIVLADGRVMVWRCPDDLVPEMPNDKLTQDARP